MVPTDILAPLAPLGIKLSDDEFVVQYTKGSRGLGY